MGRTRIRGDINKQVLGINWGGVKTKGWFGTTVYQKADLDFYIVIVSKKDFRKKLISFSQMHCYYYNNPEGEGIHISSDDNYGDLHGDDQKDNEFAILDLSKIDNNSILLPVLLKYSENIDWNDLSHLEFAMYSGEPNELRENLQDLKIKKIENSFIHCLGVISSEKNKWYFEDGVNGLADKLQELKETTNIF